MITKSGDGWPESEPRVPVARRPALMPRIPPARVLHLPTTVKRHWGQSWLILGAPPIRKRQPVLPRTLRVHCAFRTTASLQSKLACGPSRRKKGAGRPGPYDAPQHASPLLFRAPIRNTNLWSTNTEYTTQYTYSIQSTIVYIRA